MMANSLRTVFFLFLACVTIGASGGFVVVCGIWLGMWVQKKKGPPAA